MTTNPANVQISGNILSETGQFINGVKVNLTGTSTDSVITGTSGAYQFDVLQSQSYVITPSKNNDIAITNGISTLDIVLMQRHILNLQPLNSPYKIIAADVDASQNVSNMDIILTRALILQNITQYPGNELWKFVNSDYTGNDPMNPFPFEQSRSYSSATNAVDQHFIGVKLGDVNNSWNPNIAKAVSSNNIKFILPQQNAVTGQTISIPVIVKDFNNISGFQFTLEWDASILNLIAPQNQLLDMSYGTLQIQNGKLTALWSTENLNGLSLADGSVIFNITFEVIGTSGTSSPLTISSGITATEAYNELLEELNIQLVDGLVMVDNLTTNPNSTENTFDVGLNPNPFSNQTYISFEINTEEYMNIEVLNMLGEKVKDYSGNFSKGIHKIIWDGTNNNGQALSNGTYYINFRKKNFNKVIKAVLLK